MPILLNQQDIDFFRYINTDVYKLFFMPVKVYRRIPAEFDRVYNEDQNVNYAAPFEIEAYLPNLQGWKNTATRFGLDEQRKLIIYFSIDLFQERKIELPVIGDYVEVQYDMYKIMQTNPEDFYSNLQIPMSHICELSRVRPLRLKDESTVYEEY